MHPPTRTELTRLARIATLFDERILEQEELLGDMRDSMAALENDARQARIVAAKARLEARYSLAALMARLAQLKSRLGSPAVRSE